jgi:CheY-like chemotaxis protein
VRELICPVGPSDPKRILVADDAAGSRDLMRSILEESNFLVAEASDGEQVLEIIQEFAPHLVILDLQMPRLDGYATIAALRRIPMFEQTPIIAMTAAPGQTVPDKLTEAGFTGYLVKPVRPSKLRQCVAKALRS